MTAVQLVLIVLATARVTRFVTSDKLFDRPRAAVLRRLYDRNDKSMTAYLIMCDWCTSVYTGAAAAGAWWAWGETMPFMAVTSALSASYAAGFLATITDRGE